MVHEPQGQNALNARTLDLEGCRPHTDPQSAIPLLPPTPLPARHLRPKRVIEGESAQCHPVTRPLHTPELAKKLKPGDGGEAKPVTADVIRTYEGKIARAKTAEDKVRGEKAQAIKHFEDMGGDKRALKEAMRLKGLDSLDAQKYVRTLGEYSGALGVFDQADLFSDLFRGDRQPGEGPTVQSMQAANQEGARAGLDGADRDTNPYGEDDERREQWFRGWEGGQKQLAAKMGNGVTRTTADQARAEPA